MTLETKATIQEIGKEKLFVASDDVLDRQGEIIDQDGWDLTSYRKNPVIHWAHNTQEPPIAVAEKLGFKTINGKKKLVYQPKFHRKTPMSNYIADLVEANVLKASSVGFRPLEQDENRYVKTELLEISIVGVPCNQNALALGKSYDFSVVKSIFPDAEIEKSVIPYKKYPLSTADSWDGPAEIKDASIDDLKMICAWYDQEKPEIKSSYKLPHHEVSGYKTNFRGVAAAMGALLGARGGVDVPDADRRGIYNHLARHYEDFDKEAPAFKMADEIVDKYVENINADDKILALTKTVNVFIEEIRNDTETKKKIAARNADSFQKEIIKRFENIEFNIQGLTEGIRPTEKGLEQRLLDIEANVEQIALDIRKYLTSQSQEEKGVTGRDPKQAAPEDKTKETRRLAIKALHKVGEILDRTK